MRHSVKKKLLGTAIILIACAAIAVTYTSYRGGLAWDTVPSTTNYTVDGYDIALTQTNVTATDLGNADQIASVNGLVASTRINGALSSNVLWKTFINSDLPAGIYLAWARTVANPVGVTNIIPSDWTNLVGQWVQPPPPPSNFRITWIP